MLFLLFCGRSSLKYWYLQYILAVGTFSESLLFLDFLKGLFLCPWTNSLVFAVFRSFFQLELFSPKNALLDF